MSSDILARNLEGDLYPKPLIDAEGISGSTFNWYSRLIGERIQKLPQHIGSMSNRLNGYARSFGNRLRNLRFKVRREDPNLGGYFNTGTDETVYNGALAETNPKFARHSITHEMGHLLQKITGAIKMYTETLSDHYSRIYENVGKKLENSGFSGIRNYMKNYGHVVGLYRARAVIEGNASDLTSLIEGEHTPDAYSRAGYTQAMRKARENLGVGVVTAPQSRGEVLKVDKHLDLIPAFA